jgi:hypothetical protein
VRGEFGPCVLTRNAEHRCNGVIAEGDERALMRCIQCSRPVWGDGGNVQPLGSISLAMGWSLRRARLALCCAVSPLRPHVIARTASEPLLSAAWIVGGQGVDRTAGATGTRRRRLLGIRRAMADAHAPTSALDAPCIGADESKFCSNGSAACGTHFYVPTPYTTNAKGDFGFRTVTIRIASTDLTAIPRSGYGDCMSSSMVEVAVGTESGPYCPVPSFTPLPSAHGTMVIGNTLALLMACRVMCRCVMSPR